MSELLAYIQKLQAIEDDLRNAASFTSGDMYVLTAWRKVSTLRQAMQAEVDRCEAAYARELRETENELAAITNPVYAQGTWPGVR